MSKVSQFEERWIGRGATELHQEIRVAIANMHIKPDHVLASCLRTPVRSRERLSQLAHLLNSVIREAKKEKKACNLLVLPEVSVPHAWLSMMVSFSRKHQIGLVFGLEHEISGKDIAYNRIVTVLPYLYRGKHKASLPWRRLKRYYSPEEIELLNDNHLRAPEQQAEYNKPPYDLFRWKGASFAVYNCYELANIENRSLFKGKVDFIVCSEFNRDTNYFSNIVESAARDLHCFVIQVNDSHFGDSRIVSPSKTEKMNVVRIKGGENITFLTATLNLQLLRDFQSKAHSGQRKIDNFKFTPPGLERSDVLARIAIGKKRTR